MSEILNHYELLEPFQNKNAGFSRWTYARKGGQSYFIKEFLNPVYPISDSISYDIRQYQMKECIDYENKKKKIYRTINSVSDGNVVRIQEFFRYDSHYYIVTDKVVSSCLSVEDIQQYPLETRVFLCKQIAHSIMKFHLSNVVHADIKESNIIIKKKMDDRLIGKIIDFDASFFENDPPIYEDELGGDQVYFAPEACQFICGEKVELTRKMDVFALGLLFHQYLVGKLPDFDKNEYDYAYDAVLDDSPLYIDESIPDELANTIARMLERDPKQRIPMQEVFRNFVKYERPDLSDNEIGCLEETDSEEENSNEKDDTSAMNSWFVNAGDL